MKALILFLTFSSAAQFALAAGPFETGCKKAATEVFCPGHKDCTMGFIMAASKKGNNSEKGGYDECKEFGQFVKAQGVPVDAKRTIARLKNKIADFNKEIKKDFPFLTLTADFNRLELEHMFASARYQDHYGRDKKEESPIVGLARDDASKQFDYRYLNDIKTALYNVGKDEVGKEALKSKIKEIKLGFYSHLATAYDPQIKIEDKVVIIPGVFTMDNSMFCGDLQKFLESKM